MKILDTFQETYDALSSNKARSGLTILGIIIGIASVIVMVAIGQGAQESIKDRIQSIGSNLILIMPGTQRGPGFTISSGRGSARTLVMEDADAIGKKISGLEAVAPELSSRYQATSKGKNTNTSIIGVTPAYPAVRNVEIDQGSFIANQHLRNLSKVAVLGPAARDDLFDEGANPIGQKIRINRVEFKVIGITKEKGGTGFGSSDDVIYIPLTTAQRFLAGDNYLTTISVKANDAGEMQFIQQQITDLLLIKHDISDPQLADFNIMNQEDIVATASSVTETFTILLAAIAGISLIVGGIGIMNMMLTTVTERTKEIGLRKAVGAKRYDINVQFLTETMMLTFIGGFFGVILGWMVSFVIDYLEITQTQVSASSVLLAFGVSAAIGIIFGYYPAQRAAALNPIDALRYE